MVDQIADLCDNSDMTHPLPEIAVLFATYLRQALGDEKIIALVDLEVPCINIGHTYEGRDAFTYTVFPPAQPGEDWTLDGTVYDPGSYDEPPTQDAVQVVSTPHLSIALSKLIEHMFQERIAGLLEGFDYDINRLYNGDPQDVSP